MIFNFHPKDLEYLQYRVKRRVAFASLYVFYRSKPNLCHLGKVLLGYRQILAPLFHDFF